MLNQEEWEDTPPTNDIGGETSKMEKWNMGKIRPQILVAIICATIFSVFALWIGSQMDATLEATIEAPKEKTLEKKKI